MDTVSREETATSWSHLTPPKDPASTPRALYPGQSPINCPPPCRGREEARNAPGGGGDPAETVQRETHDTGGGGCSTPSLSVPPPRGDIPSMHCRGRASPRLDVNTLPKSCLVPWHGHQANRQSTARPLVGGGRRPRSGRAVGVVYVNRSTAKTGDRGGGCSTPATGEPPPPRGDSPWIQSPGIWQSLRGLT